MSVGTRDKERAWALFIPEVPLCRFRERFAGLVGVFTRDSSSPSL